MKTLTFISAWVCAMLLSANASAQSVTYNFVVADEGTTQLPTWGAEVTSGGVALNLLAVGSETFDNRFAVGPTNRNNESGNCFKFRTSGDWKGLWSQYSDRNISILNLKKGDKVTFVISKDGQTLKQVGGSAVVSGQAITVTEDGNLDFVSTGNVYIEKVVIEEPVSSVPVTVGVAGYSNEYNFKGLGEETADISATSPLISAGGETFGNRFEFAFGVKTTDVKFTKNYGLKILWAHKLFYVKDLKVGEKVTINFTTTAINISGTSILNNVDDNGAITSGTTYTVKTAGALILDNQNKNTTIEDITISKAEQNIGGATLVSENALDFTDVDDIKAYVATDADAGSVTFKQVKRVPANTPLYLTADDVVSVEVPVLDGDAEAITTNLLKGSATAATSLISTNDIKYYVFGVLKDEAGFYPVGTSKTLTSAAGKAYLQLTADQAGTAQAPAARISMVFADGSETTGISTAEVSTAKEDNVWYTLQGVRVAQPTRGIYVRNGKKVFVK